MGITFFAPLHVEETIDPTLYVINLCLVDFILLLAPHTYR